MSNALASTAIRHATIDDLDRIAPLFDAYRQFYGQAADIELARAFLAERFRHRQSVILVAVTSADEAVGFAQLYPSFSSVRAQRTFVLNDLFVAPAARRHGVAQSLLHKAAEAARSLGAVRLSLSTARSNAAAQALYEAQGWTRDEVFYYYGLTL